MRSDLPVGSILAKLERHSKPSLRQERCAGNDRDMAILAMTFHGPDARGTIVGAWPSWQWLYTGRMPIPLKSITNFLLNRSVLTHA